MRRVFQTKEGKIILAFLMLLVILIGIFSIKNYVANRQYKEQAVMAEKHLKEGNYELAVEAYVKAISMKNSDQELLSMGLAEAYIGVNDYDKALEVLRACYQKTSGNIIKEKIEDVTTRKTDYKYLQFISRANIYFSNEEYDKAIAEYEKAKQIKSKEITTYRHITEAYIKKGEYNLAQEEILECIALTQSEELNDMLELVESYLLKQQYDAMLAEAAEYIYQENYEDGVKKYEEAIKLMPMEEQAYSGLAEAYLTMKAYPKAIVILQGALENIQSDALEGILERAFELVAIKEERTRVLSQLYNALNLVDVDKAMELMNTEAFRDRIAVNTPVYYSPLGEGNLTKNYGMIIYNSEIVYSGEVRDISRIGSGIYFMLSGESKEHEYYYYQGKWSKDIPNGEGKTVEVKIQSNEKGEKLITKTITEGLYNYGVENGEMIKQFYSGEKETERLSYTAKNGTPMPINDENGQPIRLEDGKPYEIGMLYLNRVPTGEFYRVKPGTIWGVKTFIKK